MRRLRLSPHNKLTRSLFLVILLLFFSLIASYVVVQHLIVGPSLQQFNKVLAYEIRTLVPGHDVIDWKIANKNYQAYRVNKIAADLTYYQFLVSKQQALMKHKLTHHTPKSIIVYDENNQPIKVLIKEKV